MQECCCIEYQHGICADIQYNSTIVSVILLLYDSSVNKFFFTNNIQRDMQIFCLFLLENSTTKMKKI